MTTIKEDKVPIDKSKSLPVCEHILVKENCLSSPDSMKTALSWISPTKATFSARADGLALSLKADSERTKTEASVEANSEKTKNFKSVALRLRNAARMRRIVEIIRTSKTEGSSKSIHICATQT